MSLNFLPFFSFSASHKFMIGLVINLASCVTQSEELTHLLVKDEHSEQPL